MNLTKKLGLTALTLFTAATINTVSSQTLDEYKQMYQSSQKTITELKNDLAELNIKAVGYETKVDELNKKNTKLTRENKTYKKGSSKKYIKQIESLSADTTAQGIENRKLKAELAEKTKEYLASVKNQAKENISEKENCDSIVKANTADADKFIVELKDSIGRVNVALNQANNTINTYENLKLTIGKNSVPMIAQGQELVNEFYKAYSELKAKNMALINNPKTQVDSTQNNSSKPKIVYEEKKVTLNNKEITATEGFKKVFKAATTYAQLNKEANEKIAKYENLKLTIGKNSVPMIAQGQELVNEFYKAYSELKAKNTNLEEIIAGKRDSENKTNFDKAQETQIKLNKQTKELNQYKTEVKAQKDSIDSLNILLNGNNKKLETALAKKSNDELYTKINSLEDQVTKVKQKEVTLVKIAEDAQKRNNKLYQDSISQLTKQITEYKSEINECQNAFEAIKEAKAKQKANYEAKLAQAKNNTSSDSIAKANTTTKYTLTLDGETYNLTTPKQIQSALTQLGNVVDNLDGKVTKLTAETKTSKIIRADQLKQLNIYEDSIASLNKEVEFQTDYATAQSAKIKELKNKTPEKEIVYVKTSNGNTSSNNNPYVVQLNLKTGTFVTPIGKEYDPNVRMVKFFIENYLAGEVNVFKDVVTNSNPTEALEDRKTLNEYGKQYQKARTDDFYKPKLK